MTRKTPEERYPSMDVVIDVLENWLGLRAGPKTADERDYNESIQQAAQVLSDSPAAKLRRLTLLGAGGAWLAFLLLLLTLGAYQVALVIAGFGMLTASALALTSKSARPSGLVDLVREVLLGGGLRSWIVTGIGLVVLVVLVLKSGLICSLLFLGLCVGSLLGAFYYFVDRPFAAESATAVSGVTDALRRLRRAGYDERKLRAKLADAAGRRWEPLFAAVFGDRRCPLSGSADSTIHPRASFRAGSRGREPLNAAWRVCSNADATGACNGCSNTLRKRGSKPRG